MSHPDEDGEERPAAVRQGDVGVEQVFLKQGVVEGRQSGKNSRQLQVQLVWLKTHDDIITMTHLTQVRQGKTDHTRIYLLQDSSQPVQQNLQQATFKELLQLT